MGNEAKKTFVQLLKYGVIGVSNTLITLVVFYVINTLMGLDYAVANTLGYILGLINSFVWNRTWVFRTGGNVWREAGLDHFVAAYEEYGRKRDNVSEHGGVYACQLRIQPFCDIQKIADEEG